MKVLGGFRCNWLSQGPSELVGESTIFQVVKMECLQCPQKIYKCKKNAMNLIVDSHVEQYKRLWDYCNVLKLKNPGSMTLLKVERPIPSSSSIFERIFICFDAMKRVTIHYRPFLGLDV